MINCIASLYGIELILQPAAAFKLVLLNIAFASASELERSQHGLDVAGSWRPSLSACRAGIKGRALTARLGIKAMEVCRPLPWIDGDKPRTGDFRRG
ncbi:DUF697 domain-containing protein [Enterobacter cloacae subsp. cloacae]|nr:DUF697 domain-containing protein [Enterobacter cloacae subsp. cloacae]